MKHITKLKLAVVHQLCNAEEKSTEYMLQLMQDVCEVNLGVCVKYMKLQQREHEVLFREVIELFNVVNSIRTIKQGEVR